VGLAITLLLLVACQSPASGPGEVETPCAAPGTVITGQVEESGRGYPYRYAIYLPPCYQATSTTRYPVLYLIPGRSGGPGDWLAAGLARRVDSLIHGGDVPPLVVVSTETTDFDAAGAVILSDLLPAVEREYAIAADRGHRAVAGGSLGGVTAYRLAFSRPDLFSTAGMFGSGLIAGEEEQVEQWLSAMALEERPRVFLNSGEQDTLMLERARVMVALLDGAGLESTLITGPGGHSYEYWLANFPAYLRWLAEGW
jgi:enterochelin esterase family protein